ncbi:glycerate kinase [uncultured Kriegella sp.]|uniref:glycerate kinase n=1 Tax=uncultured Kriegella sp. TaxID=1798910 RepID=UPI0030DC3E51|tara:strand:+ start:81126 stop:82259 length:1134 start_codon:yes stop_codon:yes gene_type:complete
MNIVIAPDSFKECLSAKEVATAIAKGVFQVIPEAEVFEVPISDGGEGLLDTLMQGSGGRLVQVTVKDPLMRSIQANYGILEDKKTAVIEMALASGLELLQEDEKNPLVTSTYGTGQLIKDALDRGCTKLIIGIGGSATNDGGAGMARALGAKFLDSRGKELKEGGGGLNDLDSIDLTDFDKRLSVCEVVVACDVSNPLTGPNGASFVYGPQKGGSEKDVMQLDKNLANFAEKIKEELHIDIAETPGAGAAGGIGAALMAFMQGKLVNGIELVLETLGLEEYIKKSNLVITGEGKIDSQTLHGKTIAGVTKMAKKYKVPVVVVTGKIGEDIEPIYDMGVCGVFAIVNQPMNLEQAINEAPQLIQNSVKNIIGTLNCFR